IFEVWHYDNIEQYHSTRNPDGGLFTQYVNTFMEMKLDSEGYLTRVLRDEQKREYEMEVYNQGNISLDPSKISKNPGKRALKAEKWNCKKCYEHVENLNATKSKMGTSVM
uniref:Uncharacterized protein n=1 Tax=Romanomermis culicivorax TaxID=13658 RepID=A0A915HTU9_ROMCU